MADLNRKTPGKPPISQHPLFAAVVALWFGALFGLASVAIHPALIEQSVVATGIDSVVPMAAPPLGTTTRILLALLMTGVGGALGAVLARRIARPAPETRERKRAAFTSEAAPSAGIKPIAEPANRRRALALEDEDAGIPFSEHAPVPGAAPRILDVNEFELEGFEEVHGLEDDPFETGNPFAAPPEPEAPVRVADETAVVADDATALESRPPDGAQVFQPIHADEDSDSDPSPASVWDKPELAAPFDGPRAGAPSADPAPAAENRLFTAYSREIAHRAGEAQRLGTPSVSAAAAPGFNLLPRMNLAAWDEEADDDADAPVAGPLFVRSPATAPLVEASTAPDHAEWDAADPAVGAETLDDVDRQSSSFDDPSAAERIAGADLDSLSHVELLERLAIAIERRREDARAAATVAAAPPPLSAVPEIEPSEAETTAPFAPPLAEFEPQARLAPPEADFEPRIVPIMPIPAALRPVTFDQADDDDDAAFDAFVPRHLGAGPPPAVPATALADDAAASDGESDKAAASDGEGEEDEAILEEGYSSLLNLSRATPRAAHAPIVEPEDEDEPRPFVVFPGQEASGAGPFARPAGAWTPPAADPEPSAAAPSEDVRRFDAPSGDVTRADPAHNEQALRSALTALQRMSGAA